jgi:hypothetical protein
LYVHSELGRFRSSDLRRLDVLLARFPAPRRLLVQWVPHGFGYHSMNVWFCVWLLRRARAGDNVELMVHEPYLEFGPGPVRHFLMACVHRVMTMLLLRAAQRVWLSIPAWEDRLKPYALGRRVVMRWLPVPGCVAPGESRSASAIRARYGAGRPLLGHFGTYGSAITTLLMDRLTPVLDGPFAPSLLLLGSGSERFRDALIARHPSWAPRVHAAGYIKAEELGAHIAACDVFVQPYPDGVTTRRTSVMACLAHARAVVTTRGHLTEPIWDEAGAVALANVTDASGFVAVANDLLGRDEARRRLGAVGQHVYLERFSLVRVVESLRAA